MIARTVVTASLVVALGVLSGGAGFAQSVSASAASSADAASMGGASGGSASGGIVLDGNGPQNIAVSGFRYDPATNTFSANGWTYRPRISAEETYDLFQAVKARNLIAMDVSTAGNAAAPGLPRAGKVAQRMIVADILLGDITKGFGYITPLYRLANNYQPVPYVTRPGAQRYAEFYAFKPAPFVVANGVLTSPGRGVIGYDVPVVVQPDGTRRFDMAAIGAGAQDPAIRQNMNHVLTNIDYYARERVVREMFDYAEVAEFARVLKQHGIGADDVWRARP